MQLVKDLPGEPTALVAADDGAVYVVLAGDKGGLVVLRDGELRTLNRGPVGGAAIGPDKRIYYTADQKILSASVSGSWKPEEVTAEFGGSAAGAGRVFRTPDGRIWVEGSRKFRGVEGSFAETPEYSGANVAPIPVARDLYDNHWAVAGVGAQAELVVLRANAPEAWQVVPFPQGTAADQWSLVTADDFGMVWIGGKGGLRQMDPRAPEEGWRAIPGTPGLSLASPTALGLSPAGMAMAGLISGEVIEIDLGHDANLHIEVLSEGASAEAPIRVLTTDGDGNTWVGVVRQLFRIEARRGAWQKKWQALGRLPGGNHDIFAAVHDGKLWTSGGATWGWGYPAVPHTFDELWSYDPETDVWSVEGHLPFHRCYNGIAALDGEIWNVGGAVYEEDKVNSKGERLPLDDVDIYDPEKGSWRQGPALGKARQEPVVVTAGGRVYAIGGSGVGNALDAVESIGPGETTWRSEPSLLRKMRQYAGCVLEGVIYVVGTEGAYSLDVKGDQWEELQQPPLLPQASQVAAHDGQVWVLGSHDTTEGYRYSPRDRSWKRAPDLPSANSWGAAAELNGRLIVAGGAHGGRRDFVFDDRVYALRKDWQGAEAR